MLLNTYTNILVKKLFGNNLVGRFSCFPYCKKEGLWMAFVDLEAVFDRVPREVVWWALRSLGIDELLVSVVQSM